MHFSPKMFAEELGQRLVSGGMLDQRALQRASRVARDHGERLDRVLTKLGLLPETELAQVVAEYLKLPLLNSEDMTGATQTEANISLRFYDDHNVVVVGEDDRQVRLAMADPLDDYAVQAVSLITGKNVVRLVAPPSLVQSAVSGLRSPGDVDDDAHPEVAHVTDEDIERLRDLASEAPIIRAVNQMVVKAAELRASDIHLEPENNELRVRYRVDGLLREMPPIDVSSAAAVLSRIKIMAKLDIAERRLPQDGRVMLAIKGTPIDIRVSTMPTVDGESVVMRLLDSGGVQLDFAALGFAGSDFERFRRDLDVSNGIVLVTGPTGSGKTTTLYTALTQLNREDRNLLTVEDPVEYRLDGVNQIQVKSDIGLSFAPVLRSMLRHDPDIIMIGEIRDGETAEIAIQAALTGHLVLSTLHTNDAASSISRLLDMGIEGYLIAATLRGVLAQRLVRRLCFDCRAAYPVDDELAAELHLPAGADNRPKQLYRAVGCPTCGGSGYRGRLSVFEYLPITEEIQRLTIRGDDASQIGDAAVAAGMRTILQDGLTKAIAGETTVDEIMRVTRSRS